jgi:hypothetical protein
MNWNPFKRIAALEQELNGLKLSHNRLIDRIDLLGRTDDAQARWLSALEARLQDLNQTQGKLLVTLESRLRDISNPVTISRADGEKEAKARIRRAAYARKYYAKKRAEKAAGDAK